MSRRGFPRFPALASAQPSLLHSLSKGRKQREGILECSLWSFKRRTVWSRQPKTVLSCICLSVRWCKRAAHAQGQGATAGLLSLSSLLNLSSLGSFTPGNSWAAASAPVAASASTAAAAGTLTLPDAPAADLKLEAAPLRGSGSGDAGEDAGTDPDTDTADPAEPLEGMEPPAKRLRGADSGAPAAAGRGGSRGHLGPPRPMGLDTARPALRGRAAHIHSRVTLPCRATNCARTWAEGAQCISSCWTLRAVK